MHTVASLKAEHKTLDAAKTAYKVKATSWQALADKINGSQAVSNGASKPLDIAELKAVTISSNERQRLIKRISKASGIAKYALIEKMTDEQVVEAVAHIEILELVKDAINYNRFRQGKLTEKANKLRKEAEDKLKDFIRVTAENSEFIKAGKWLFSALSMTGQERHKTLLDKDLVHKEEYNEAILEIKNTVVLHVDTAKKTKQEAEKIIQALEQKVDNLRRQLSQIKDYISSNHGGNEWKNITEIFNMEEE